MTNPTPDTALNTYLKDVTDRLDDWERKIGRLQQKAQQARPLKSTWRQPVEQRVEPQLEALRNRINALRATGATGWEDMRGRVEDAEARPASAYEAVADEFDAE